jgi:hypothetical protein
MLFKAEHDLPVGTLLEVSLSWPAPLGEKYPLCVVARGVVARHENA